MPIDASIPLSGQQPNAMATLSGLLDMRNTMQQYQNMQTQNQVMQNEAQKQQNMLGEYNAARSLLQDPSKYTDENGNFDMGKASSDIMRVAPTIGPEMINNLEMANRASTAAKEEVNNLNAQQRQQVAEFTLAQQGKPPAEAIANIQAFGQKFGLGNTTGFATQYLLGPAAQAEAAGQKGAFDQAILKMGQSVMSVPNQVTAITPSGVTVNNGQQQVGINTAPMAPGGTGSKFFSVQNELPPNTPTVQKSADGSITPGYLGPLRPDEAAIVQTESGGNGAAVSPKGAQGAWQVMPNTQANPGFGVAPAQNNSPEELSRVGRDYYNALVKNYGNPTLAAIAYNMGPQATDQWIKQGADYNKLPQETQAYLGKVSLATAMNQRGQGNGFVASGAPLGQKSNIENNVGEMNRHFGSLQDQSTGMPLVSALQGTIKGLIPGAITGTESGKKAYVTGLLNALHMGNQATGDLQKDTDLLDKALSQLNLITPASTDAARTLVTAARPHSTMNAAAMSEAVDQIASQVKANMAERNALSQYKMNGDYQSYQNTRQQIEQNIDPRIFQYRDATPQERQTIISQMTPQDRAQIGQKMKKLEALGVL